MNKDEIKKLLLKGERVTLEAKLAEKEVPKSIWIPILHLPIPLVE